MAKWTLYQDPGGLGSWKATGELYDDVTTAVTPNAGPTGIMTVAPPAGNTGPSGTFLSLTFAGPTGSIALTGPSGTTGAIGPVDLYAVGQYLSQRQASDPLGKAYSASLKAF